MSGFTILPDGSAFCVANISISWWKTWRKKMEMRDWWLRRPRSRCPRCRKGLYSYWDGNDVDNHGTNYCNKCARILEASNKR